MEYKCNKVDDFWKRFISAEDRSIHFKFDDARWFATIVLLISLGRYKSYAFGEIPDGVAFWNKFCAPLRSNLRPLDRCSYMAFLKKNTSDSYNQYTIEEVESAISSDSSERLPISDSVTEIKNFIDGDSLWFDQKVLIGFCAALSVFFPDRRTSGKKTMWNRELHIVEETNESDCNGVLKFGCRHFYAMSQCEWNAGGFEAVVDAVVDAHLREIMSADLDKLNFDIFRPLFASDYDNVISKIKTVFIAYEFSKIDRVLYGDQVMPYILGDYRIGGIQESVNDQIRSETTIFKPKLRKPAELYLRTFDEEIYVQVWEQQSWLHRKVKSSVASFFRFGG